METFAAPPSWMPPWRDGFASQVAGLGRGPSQMSRDGFAAPLGKRPEPSNGPARGLYSTPAVAGVDKSLALAARPEGSNAATILVVVGGIALLLAVFLRRRVAA